MKTLRARTWLSIATIFFLHQGAFAVSITPTNSAEPWLDSWNFLDTNTWKSDAGNAPATFTNLHVAKTYAGANALLIDSSSAARLQYYPSWTVSGTNYTNINANGPGTALVWYSPDWCSANNTNQVGHGPGVAGRLLEVGSYGSNGWLSLFFATNGNTLYFATQTNGGAKATNLSATISFESNTWHFIAVEWSATNSALAVDGVVLTNGAGVTTLPGPAPTDFRLGSDASGLLQMRGAINNLVTYNYPLDAETINQTYLLYSIFYLTPSELDANAPAISEITNGYFSVFSGRGALTPGGIIANCGAASSNVWITNLTVTASGATNPLYTVSFTVGGGEPDTPYDVFATGGFLPPTNNTAWTWLGQAYKCVTNTITFTEPDVYLELGTPLDSDGDGLTDAYEHLVSKTNPTNASSGGSGFPDGWVVLQGLNPWTITATNDPDQDGLSNLQEYQYGTNPNVAEGFTVWVSAPLSTSSIP